ncbi:MAG: zinc ABC transporter substrate-binding protein [Alphaproteobacteria bacterium]|nr:zinc ABC transporter substrate-binding protein [Alphaproteobacteria bacterium]
MGISRRTMLAGLPLLPIALPGGARAEGKLRVVASFSIIADLVAQVGGARVTVAALVGPDQDMHAFQPRPSDAQAIAAADLLVINGLGLEPWAERLAAAAGYRKAGVVASRGVKALVGGHRHHGGGQAHDHGAFDPHAWQDVANVRLYVANIRDGLIAADPAGAAAYRAAAVAYLARLDRLELDIKAAFLPIPRTQRLIVTSHEAFNYYGDAYDVDFLAPRGLSSDHEPSAKEIAALVAQIRAEKVRALFLENTAAPGLLRQIARETGVAIGGTLYGDALTGPGGKAASYEAMMRHNTATIVAALR